MSTTLITQLLESKLAGVAASLGLEIAMENITFKPKDSKAIYLRSHILPAKTLGIDIAGALQVFRGVFQVDVVAPAGSGKTKAGEVADSILNAFPAGLELTSGEFTAYIEAVPYRMRPLPSDTRYLIPVNIDYRADTVQDE